MLLKQVDLDLLFSLKLNMLLFRAVRFCFSLSYSYQGMLEPFKLNLNS